MLLRRDVPLAPFTTMKLGGPASALTEVTTEADLLSALADAANRLDPILVLGGGSNVVIADEGWPGTVVRVGLRGIACEHSDSRVRVRVAAGEEWDAIVATAVDEGWVGLECLAGIPGLAGATPIQNVGAYGVEVADVLECVRAWDRSSEQFVRLDRSSCEFSYRDSMFKRQAGRYVVTEITLDLTVGMLSGPIRYAELARTLGIQEGERAPLHAVRDVVLNSRRSKGMVVDPCEPESVSAGSYFTNPIVSAAQWVEVQQRTAGEKVPGFCVGVDRWKVPAAWLIEHSGFSKGYTRDGIGISRKHALALVNRGGSTRALLALEEEIINGVRSCFGITLEREPMLA